MSKSVVYLTNGIEIIDNTPEAYVRLSAMEYIEERQRRRTERERKRQAELLKNPLYKLACMCGMM